MLSVLFFIEKKKKKNTFYAKSLFSIWLSSPLPLFSHFTLIEWLIVPLKTCGWNSCLITHKSACTYRVKWTLYINALVVDLFFSGIGMIGNSSFFDFHISKKSSRKNAFKWKIHTPTTTLLFFIRLEHWLVEFQIRL